jgi:putative GTP pyrophosphokinase
MAAGIVNSPTTSEDPEAQNLFLEEYARYVKEVLQPTQVEIQDHLSHWQQPESWAKYKTTNRIPIPTPVRSIASRIKRPEQVVDKVLRKPAQFPDGIVPASFRRMYDAIGVRVLVYFLSHLPLIDRELRSSELFDISTEEPPAAYMSTERARLLSLDHLIVEEKESGYRSVHYTLRLKRSSLPDEKRPWFELQVRTLAQDLWSSLEHHLGYKPGWRSQVTARRQLKILAKHIANIDEHFNFLYEELNRFQQEREYAPQDPLSVESLPAVLAEVGISCAQRDLNNIVKFLLSRHVATVRDFRALVTTRRLDIIRNTFVSVAGRNPVNLEVIAALAAMRGAANENEEIESIKTQIHFRGAWDEIRREFTAAEVLS